MLKLTCHQDTKADMGVPDSLSEIERHFRERAQKRQWVSLLAAGYLRLGFPALLSLTILYKEPLGAAFWPVIISTSLVQGLSVLVRALTGKSEYAFFESRDLEHTHEELQSQYENEGQDDRCQYEDGGEESVSYYDFLPDRLFRKYLRGDEEAGRRALEEVRREVESDLREARR